MASKVIQQPARYENVQLNGLDGVPPDKVSCPKPHPLESHVSEPILRISDGSAVGSADSAPSPTISKAAAKTSAADSPKSMREAKYKLLIPVQAPERGGECAQCQELSQILSLWELGVGGIARNCSKILSQLNQARNAHQALECRLEEKADLDKWTGSSVTKSLDNGRMQKAAHRKSLYTEREDVSSATNGTNYLVEQMYPDQTNPLGALNSNSVERVNLPYEHYLQLLNTHLGQAIDLCQHLAAACFKSNQSVSTSSTKDMPRLRRQPTAPVILRSTAVSRSANSPTVTAYRSPLQSLAEEKPSPPKVLLKGNFVRTSSNPGIFPHEDSDTKYSDSDSELQNQSRENERLAKKMLLSGSLEDSWEKVEDLVNVTTVPGKVTAASKVDDDSKSDTSSVSSKGPFHNPVLSILGATEQKKLAKEAKKNDADELTELVLSSSSCASNNARDSILSTYSDNDVKQVMTKIASLEEERIKLLDTIDKLHKDNQLVRLSLGELLGDLESKDLQLSLAMQDLSIATDEIKKAAEFRCRLASLEKEKEQLSEHLSNLEDESAAVKVSLIRLLQEKSATNKTLALENWRLTQRTNLSEEFNRLLWNEGSSQIKEQVVTNITGPAELQMRHMSVRKASKSSGGSQSAASPGAEGDNVSVASGFNTFNEDAELQEAYIGFDDAGHFVHKQGFLKKQGAKVKSWKRRLFVLNIDGLAYFKTEQPIQTIPLDKIDKVQVCHGRTVHPNMFEVHTQGRVFMLSAPSEDEMQSWVGMLQTLKQYNKVTAQAQLQAQSLAQAQAESVVQAKSADSPSPTHRKIVQSEVPMLEPVNLPPVHHHKPLSHTTSAPSSEYDKLDDDDIDTKLSEPRGGAPPASPAKPDIPVSSSSKVVNSMPNSPIDFGSATLDSPVDVIASLNLQVKPIDI